MKLIIKIIIVIFLSAVVFFTWQKRNKLAEECLTNSSLTDEVNQDCQQRVTEMINDSLIEDYPVTINIPDNGKALLLSSVKEFRGMLFVSGEYEELLRAEPALYDRGSVHLNLPRITLLNEQRGANLYFVAPFVVNVMGSAIFSYTGLFSYNLDSKQTHHLDSFFLGDRVREERIEIVKDTIRISYLDYGPEQARSDYPNVAIEKNVQLVNVFNDNATAKFKEVKRMHSSWDKNKDGVNDCEMQGSCDHSIDYSQARPE